MHPSVPLMCPTLVNSVRYIALHGSTLGHSNDRWAVPQRHNCTCDHQIKVIGHVYRIEALQWVSSFDHHNSNRHPPFPWASGPVALISSLGGSPAALIVVVSLASIQGCRALDSLWYRSVLLTCPMRCKALESLLYRIVSLTCPWNVCCCAGLPTCCCV